jgi:FAD/FMN-containing dehydrogenase
MKRRAFLATGLAAMTSASIRPRRVSATTPSVDVPAVGLDGTEMLLRGADVADLRAGLRGELIGPGQASYDNARRLWNPAFDRHPALIARCLGAADVQRAISFAAAHGLLTAVRGGGHSFSGQSSCDGGFVIDLSPMRAVEVDPTKREARVAAGALLGNLDREAQAFGLATPAGVVADTGVAGLTLGGGIGRLARNFGLSCDNIVAAELITADGHWVRASAEENPDLLWGLQGGGGNFGVVTEFVFRLHEVGPQVYGGTINFPFERARALLKSFADYAASAPDGLYLGVDLYTDDHKMRLVEFDVTWSGPLKDAERVVTPLRKLGKAHSDELAPSPYVALQGSANIPGSAPHVLYLKGGMVDGLTPALIDTVVGCIEGTPLDSVTIGFQPVGGAIARVAPRATAFWNRGASHSMHVIGVWKPEEREAAARNTEWVRSAYSKLEPLTHGRYSNYPGGEDHEEHVDHSRLSATYGDNYPRLAALKKRYDPANLLRLNANIKPA